MPTIVELYDLRRNEHGRETRILPKNMVHRTRRTPPPPPPERERFCCTSEGPPCLLYKESDCRALGGTLYDTDAACDSACPVPPAPIDDSSRSGWCCLPEEERAPSEEVCPVHSRGACEMVGGTWYDERAACTVACIPPQHYVCRDCNPAFPSACSGPVDASYSLLPGERLLEVGVVCQDINPSAPGYCRPAGHPTCTPMTSSSRSSLPPYPWYCIWMNTEATPQTLFKTCANENITIYESLPTGVSPLVIPPEYFTPVQRRAGYRADGNTYNMIEQCAIGCLGAPANLRQPGAQPWGGWTCTKAKGAFGNPTGQNICHAGIAGPGSVPFFMDIVTGRLPCLEAPPTACIREFGSIGGLGGQNVFPRRGSSSKKATTSVQSSRTSTKSTRSSTRDVGGTEGGAGGQQGGGASGGQPRGVGGQQGGTQGEQAGGTQGGDLRVRPETDQGDQGGNGFIGGLFGGEGFIGGLFGGEGDTGEEPGDAQLDKSGGDQSDQGGDGFIGGWFGGDGFIGGWFGGDGFIGGLFGDDGEDEEKPGDGQPGDSGGDGWIGGLFGGLFGGGDDSGEASTTPPSPTPETPVLSITTTPEAAAPGPVTPPPVPSPTPTPTPPSPSPTPSPSICGNEVVDPGEQCDHGGFCDGGTLTGLEILSQDDVAACIEEGGRPIPADYDGCSAMCRLEYCGDGIVQLIGIDGIQNTEDDEHCDSGGQFDPECDKKTCRFIHCGDAILQGSEQCDDGNDEIYDNCLPNCRLPVCGNRIVEGFEECDDGNRLDGDGCFDNCALMIPPERLP